MMAHVHSVVPNCMRNTESSKGPFRAFLLVEKMLQAIKECMPTNYEKCAMTFF